MSIPVFIPVLLLGQFSVPVLVNRMGLLLVPVSVPVNWNITAGLMVSNATNMSRLCHKWLPCCCQQPHNCLSIVFVS